MTMRATWMVLMATPLLALAACSTGPDVRALSDPSANFTQYQSFGFVSPLGTDRAGYQSVISQQLIASTRREMEARGFRYDATSPQLLVNFNARLNDKMRVTTVPDPMMGGYGYYGYRRGFYNPWPLYSERTEVTQYSEGTLTIDVVDAARKQMIWEGTVTKSVTDKDQQNVNSALDAAVVAAFGKFPVPAPAK